MTIIEIRPGEGGADALAFAGELSQSLSAYLRRAGHEVRLEETSTDRTTTLRTDCPAPMVEWLSGTHRVQRIPEGAAARHTSTATVAVLADSGASEDKRWVKMGEVRVDRYRGHGPGGQRKNKVATAVRLVHGPTGIMVTRETGRSQKENLRDAVADLEDRLRDRHNRRERSARDAARRAQVRPSREAKTFTHNQQRGEVVDHSTGQRWTIKMWRSGRISPKR